MTTDATPGPVIDDPQLARFTETVHMLGVHGRRLSWGFAVYVAYYLAIAGLVLYGGVQWTGLRQIAADVVRLSDVLVPLAGFIAVNCALAVSVRYLIALHSAGRWTVATVALLLAATAWFIYLSSLWTWHTAGHPKTGLYAQVFGLVLAAGYAYLAYRVTRIVHQLHQFVLIEGQWLPRLFSV